MEQIARFIFELGMLKKTPRTGYQFLGRGQENVAAHSFRVAWIAFILARLKNQDQDDALKPVDPWRAVALALVHDLAEARTGDHNYVNRRYVRADEARVTAEQTAGLPFGMEIAQYKAEFDAAQSAEARLARDADQLDLIFELKEHQDLGNIYARKWIDSAVERLLTPEAKTLAAQARATDWTAWWFTEGDRWWVEGRMKEEDK